MRDRTKMAEVWEVLREENTLQTRPYGPRLFVPARSSDQQDHILVAPNYARLDCVYFDQPPYRRACHQRLPAGPARQLACRLEQQGGQL